MLSLLRHNGAWLEGLVVEGGCGCLRGMVAVLETGLEGGVRVEVEVSGVGEVGGIVVIERGRVEVIGSALREHGVGLAGLPLIHDRSCAAWTRRCQLVVESGARAHERRGERAAHSDGREGACEREGYWIVV